MKKKMNHYLVIILIIGFAFAACFIVYDHVIDKVRVSKTEALAQNNNHEFDFIWNYLNFSISVADDECRLITNEIKQDIMDNINLNELENALNKRDADALSTDEHIIALHDIFRTHMKDQHFGDVNNNRNSMMALEGYDYIIEDMFVDPKSRSEDIDLDITKSRYLSVYEETTYNKDLFKSAINKIRNHSEQLIAIEPYNYINKNHMQIKEMNYSNLKKVYSKEGLEGLRNYQFLVPVYITDSGDIFGKHDTERGIPQVTHKFTVIILFNLYDQIINSDYDFIEKNNTKTIVNRYDNIMNAIHFFGLILCMICLIVIITILTACNAAIVDNKKDCDNITNDK